MLFRLWGFDLLLPIYGKISDIPSQPPPSWSWFDTEPHYIVCKLYITVIMLKVLKLSDLKRWPWLFEWKTFLFNPQCSSNLNLTRIYNTYNTHILWTTMNDVCKLCDVLQCTMCVRCTGTVHCTQLSTLAVAADCFVLYYA